MQKIFTKSTSLLSTSNKISKRNAIKMFGTGSRRFPKETSISDAVSCIKSHDNVWIHSSSATPKLLVQALSDRYKELRDVNLYHLHFEGAAPFIQPTHQQAFRDHSFFIGANVRKSVQEGRATYIPTFLSEIPLLFQRGIVPLDVSLINVSPPDKHGFCSLGTSVECTLGAIQASKVVIAQVNTRMPRVHGHGIIHISKLDYIVHCDDPLPQVEAEPITDQVMAIGKNIANLIENGSTLQMGIGSIPNAVLACLHDHERLGLHTEMFSDGIIDLVERGVITNEEKTNENKHISIFGFCLGSQRLYDFIDDNPFFEAHSIDIVNDPRRIASNPKMVAINSAIEVDLTGQVCADSIGSKMFSGVGGQVDFMRGAALSQGGKPIIAIPSVTAKGESKIVPTLKSGAGVVTTRAHVRHVVTEYGVANLWGKSLRDRAKALISIAHPAHRESLTKSLVEELKYS